LVWPVAVHAPRPWGALPVVGSAFAAFVVAAAVPGRIHRRLFGPRWARRVGTLRDAVLDRAARVEQGALSAGLAVSHAACLGFAAAAVGIEVQEAALVVLPVVL